MVIALALALATTPAVTVDDLVHVVDLGGLAASPDGHWVAFRTEHPSMAANAVLVSWWVAPADGRTEPRRVADGGEALVDSAGVVVAESPRWLPDGCGFLFRGGVDGTVQVWRADLAQGRASRVTNAPGDVTAFALAADGRSVTYAAGAPRTMIDAAERRLRDTGGRVDASVDLSIGLVGGAVALGRAQSVRMTPEWFGRRALLDRVEAARQPLDGGPASPLPPDAAPRPSALAPDPAVKAAVCMRIDCARDQVAWTTPVPAVGGVLIATIDPSQRQTLRLWRRDRLSTVRNAAGLLSGGRDLTTPCAVAGVSAFCVNASADRPPRLERIDLETGASATLFAPNSSLDRRTAGRARPLAWRDAGGRHFTGQLVLPDGRRPRGGFPLVIHYYWCDGFLRGGVGDELPFFPLADHRIASLCINRVSGPGERQNAVADFQIAVGGLSAAIAQLAADGLVDRRRVGMQGLSFGSEVTLWVLRQTQLLAAAAIASGQFEPSSWWYHAAPGRDVARRMEEVWGLGDPDRTREAWRRVSAALGADRIAAPLLMQLPESEARWSIELFARLDRSPTPVELYVFPDAAHIKAQPRQKAAAYRRNLDWFAFWLAGVRSEDPDEPERTARWDALARRAGAKVGQP